MVTNGINNCLWTPTELDATALALSMPYAQHMLRPRCVKQYSRALNTAFVEVRCMVQGQGVIVVQVTFLQ